VRYFHACKEAHNVVRLEFAEVQNVIAYTRQGSTMSFICQ
jgi:hypothetical protein